MNAFGIQTALSEAEQARLMDVLQELQVRDAQSMYNKLAERCFDRCVDNFRGRTLDQKEEACVNTCCDKFMKYMQRVGARFAEQNMAQPGAAP
ncbi:Mitochondrial import inner membrane translocase subunit [Plasmodiophora brassicae]|uniref:Mitochondrial import inner membrane translocase subunit n=1 Tax=Plasmodiophora brassicae TaxID=37360 RepID=A0A0G4IZP6_PLABS|nr:hypothetical protein PBRA_008139 [Plasmodiophora brassicae]SPR01957.1 unnamed protein product [Plasmodiophora brassicae]